MVYLVLAALVLTAGLAPYFGRAGALALVAVSLLWLPVNTPLEGRTLLVLTPQNGFTQADLVSVVGLLLAALILVVSARDD